MSRYCSYQYHCHHQFPQTDIMMRNLSLIHNRNQYLNLNLYQWGSGFSPLNPSSSLIYFMACSRSRLFSTYESSGFVDEKYVICWPFLITLYAHYIYVSLNEYLVQQSLIDVEGIVQYSCDDEVNYDEPEYFHNSF